MKILQICFRMPYPLKDGGAIAMYNMTRAFHDHQQDLSLLIPVTPKHDLEYKDLPEEVKKLADFHTVNVNSDITFWGALKNLFTSEPYYISRYKNSAFETKLIELLKQNDFDIVQLESLKVSMYVPVIRKYSKAKIVMRSHNVEYMIWDRMRRSTRNFLKKVYLGILVKRLKKHEVGTLNDFDALVPITPVDGAYFKGQGFRNKLIPVASGIDTTKIKSDMVQVEPDSFFHLGALDWLPNQEAVQWFVEDIWPDIIKKYPGLKFYLAGRNMPESFHRWASESVEVVGEVDDAHEFMSSKKVMIVPLLSGSGMRIKIVEGMALGKVIISTSVGAEGIDYTNNENILIADSPAEFLDAVDRLMEAPGFADKISGNAKQLIKEKYDNHKIIGDLIGEYKRLIAN